MGNDRIVYIRTDGNSHIASGHLVRCISVAHACRALGMDVCFLVSDRESFCLLKELTATPEPVENRPCTCPDTDYKESRETAGDTDRNPSPLPGCITAVQLKTAQYDNLEKELPEVVSLLTSARQCSALDYDITVIPNGSATVDTHVTNSHDNSNNTINPNFPSGKAYKYIVYFADSYFVTEKYLSALSSYAATAYIDDLRAFDYPVNLIVNYDVIPPAQMPAYQNAYWKAERLLLGASYAPLRSQFLHKRITVKERLTDILITTGGSDPFHFCLGFLAYLNDRLNGNTGLFYTPQAGMTTHSCPGVGASLPFPPVTFHIVIGKLNADREKLRQAARNLPCLKFHENVSDMASLMEKCDAAVSAAGTTLYELCALGVPSVSFTMADNQLTAAKAFEDTGAVPWAGDIRTDKGAVLETVFQFMESCSYEKRKTASEAMHGLVDGKGSLRIASAIREL